MSSAPTPPRLIDLLRGRWQMPLTVLAVVVAGVALLRVVPPRPSLNFDAVLADINVLAQSGNTVAAADAVANLLAAEPPLPPAQQAVLHERMSSLIFEAERHRLTHNPENARRLLEHERAARERGLPDSPAGVLRRAWAHLWLGEEEAALSGMWQALEHELPSEDRRLALRGLVELLERRPEALSERRRALESLLADEALSPAYLWWGLHRVVRDALDADQPTRATELLTTYGRRLRTSDLRGYYEYLSALIMLHEGRAGEAVPLVHWIDAWLAEGTHDQPELHRFGHLPSLNRWLMGQIHLAEQRPQAALEEFNEVLGMEPGPELRVAAAVGCGTALAALDRPEAALEAFRSAVEEARRTPAARRRTLALIQQSLLDLYEQATTESADVTRREHSISYLELAAELAADTDPAGQFALLQRLGLACQQVAHLARDPEQRRHYHELAARNWERAADLVRDDETVLADLLWSVAEEYDQAGLVLELRRTLERFVSGRSTHPRMPQALLQLGRANEASGDLRAALPWYARVINEYPKLEEAARARVLVAGVLISLGAEQYETAERLLLELLNSDALSPAASVYHDALLTLCELLYYQGRYAAAISRLEEFQRLYPDDPEHLRARFMCADAYRRSAYALRDQPPNDVPASQAQAESRRRFQLAADLFKALLDDLDAAPQSDPALEVYTRLALFFRGDCLFELSDPDALQAALVTYRNAAARYDAQPAALAAQVQIANVLLRQGDIPEAGRAVERARWLLRSMPTQVFGTQRGGSREDWDRFLTALSSSSLFREAFGNTP